MTSTYIFLLEYSTKRTEVRVLLVVGDFTIEIYYGSQI